MVLIKGNSLINYVARGKLRNVYELVNNVENLDINANDGEALRIAALSGNSDMIHALCTRCDLDRNICCGCPLNLLIENKHFATAEIFLRYGVNAEFLSRENFELAIREGPIRLVSYLLYNGILRTDCEYIIKKTYKEGGILGYKLILAGLQSDLETKKIWGYFVTIRGKRMCILTHEHSIPCDGIKYGAFRRVSEREYDECVLALLNNGEDPYAMHIDHIIKYVYAPFLRGYPPNNNTLDRFKKHELYDKNISWLILSFLTKKIQINLI